MAKAVLQLSCGGREKNGGIMERKSERQTSSFYIS